MFTVSVDGSPSTGISFDAVLVGGAVAAGSVGDAEAGSVVTAGASPDDDESLEQAPRAKMSAVVKGNVRETLKITPLSCHNCQHHDYRRSFMGSCHCSALAR